MPDALVSPADSLPQQDEKQRESEGVDVRELVQTLTESGIKYRDEVLEPMRTRAQNYYSGEKTLNGELTPDDERSKFTTRDVRDVIIAMMTQLVAIFFGNDESAVHFTAVKPDQEQKAQDATKYVNYLVRHHGGLETFWSPMMDALKLKIGPVMFWWDTSKTVTEEEYEGLIPDELIALLHPEDPSVTVELVEQRPRKFIDHQIGEGPGGVPEVVPVEIDVIDCTVKITRKAGRVRFQAVPPEQRIIDSATVRIHDDDTPCWFRVWQVPRSSLVARGYDRDVVDNLATGDRFRTNQEAELRPNSDLRTSESTGGRVDPSLQTVPVCEGYVRADQDGDGIAELLRVCYGGTQLEELHPPKIADAIQVAEFQAYPVEHMATGESLADVTTDLQLANTGLWRLMFDSLGQSIFPQRGFDVNRVNYDDLQSGAAGALIRCNGSPQGLVQEFTRDFRGREVLPLLNAVREVRDERTGTSRATAGLDPDALQSTTKVAAAAAVSGSQRQVEMIARVMATWGFKPLFKGILKLLVKHQRTAVTAKIGNSWHTFNPSEWDPDMEVIVRTGLGTLTNEDQIRAVTMILAAQEKLMASGAPIVNWTGIYHALQVLCELSGRKDPEAFFVPPKGNEPPPAPPVDPQAGIAEAEKFKAETERLSAVEKNTNERIQLLLDDDRQRDKTEADVLLQVAELKAKYGPEHPAINLLETQLAAVIRRERNYSELAARATAMQTPVGAPQAQAQPMAPPQGMPV